MKELFSYTDPETGFEIQQYTKGPERSAKLYFTTENFTQDDQFIFFNKNVPNPETGFGQPPHLNELHKAHVETGEYYKVLGSEYRGFAMSRDGNYGVVTKGNKIFRMDCDDDKLTEIGAFPQIEKRIGPSGGRVTGHLTVSKSGLVVYSYQQRNCIFALVVLDPKTGKSDVVHQSDYHLGHTQVCPGDDNTIFYIHETGGDALQRMWMFDLDAGRCRPYYVEQDGDWITHEVWTASGDHMLFMKYPHSIMMGTKDGHNFREIAYTDKQFLHPGISRDDQWVCADRVEFAKENDQGFTSGIWLINPRTGAQLELAKTGFSNTGADHPHPSFNRKGDKIYFSNPDMETGISQIAIIDLNQLTRP